MDNQQNSPIVPERSKVLDVVYMVVLLGVIAYLIYVYAVAFDNYSEEELMTQSYYFVPALLFSIVGLFTVRSPKSIVYAVGAAVGCWISFFRGHVWAVGAVKDICVKSACGNFLNIKSSAVRIADAGMRMEFFAVKSVREN